MLYLVDGNIEKQYLLETTSGLPYVKLDLDTIKVFNAFEIKDCLKAVGFKFFKGITRTTWDLKCDSVERMLEAWQVLNAAKCADGEQCDVLLFVPVDFAQEDIDALQLPVNKFLVWNGDKWVLKEKEVLK